MDELNKNEAQKAHLVQEIESGDNNRIIRVLKDTPMFENREKYEAVLRGCGFDDRKLMDMPFSEGAIGATALIVHLRNLNYATRDARGEWIVDHTGKRVLNNGFAVFSEAVMSNPELIVDIESTVGQYGVSPEELKTNRLTLIDVLENVPTEPHERSKYLTNPLAQALVKAHLITDATQAREFFKECGVPDSIDRPDNFDAPPLDIWRRTITQLETKTFVGGEKVLDRFNKNLAAQLREQLDVTA